MSYSFQPLNCFIIIDVAFRLKVGPLLTQIKASFKDVQLIIVVLNGKSMVYGEIMYIQFFITFMSIHPKLPNAKYQARDLTLIGRVMLQHCCWFSATLNNIAEPAVGCHNAVKMNVIPTTLLHAVFNNSI